MNFRIYSATSAFLLVKSLWWISGLFDVRVLLYFVELVSRIYYLGLHYFFHVFFSILHLFFFSFSQEPHNCLLSGAVSLCNPFNLLIADEDFHKGFNNVYDKALANSLCKIFKK